MFYKALYNELCVVHPIKLYTWKCSVCIDRTGTFQPWDRINSHRKKVWCSMQTFHSFLAALWFGSLKPIVLSNCSYWRRERGETERNVSKVVGDTKLSVLTLFCWRETQYFCIDWSSRQSNTFMKNSVNPLHLWAPIKEEVVTLC